MKVKTLYTQCLEKFVDTLDKNVKSLEIINSIKNFPPIVLSDIFSEMAENINLLDILYVELCQIDLFIKLLRCNQVRENMFKCFKFLMSHNKPIASELQKIFVEKTKCDFLEAIMQMNNEKVIVNNDDVEISSDSEVCSNASDELSTNPYINISHSKNYMHQIDSGMRLGSFLSEAGWLDDSIKVLTATMLLIQQLDNTFKKYLLEFNCLHKLIHNQALFCCFKEAYVSSNQAFFILEQLNNFVEDGRDSAIVIEYDINQKPKQMTIPDSLMANFYHELSVLHFYRSEYDLSYKWSAKALEHLNQDTPKKVCVDILRQAGKSCVVKRKYPSASLLINNAVRIAEETFGISHQKYADALLDKGFLLLNVDSIQRSVAVYREALNIKRNIFGSQNLHVAVAHEDLAYALYVYEYSSGRFNLAKYEIESAIDIMDKLVPRNHLMLASAKRVKALILEEIALDSMGTQSAETDANSLLKESEELHRLALELSLEAFGEINVQTAKHYGNLGRLYQSMQRYENAEEMHQKAIKIKTDLLGAYDYEVGLSIGHLASLYNYHMNKYREAEDLYLRSINISLRLFGKTYSGLEYDYRGLLHVYEELCEETKYLRYCQVLENWRRLRVENDENPKAIYTDKLDDSSIEEITKTFFEMNVD